MTASMLSHGLASSSTRCPPPLPAKSWTNLLGRRRWATNLRRGEVKSRDIEAEWAQVGDRRSGDDEAAPEALSRPESERSERALIRPSSRSKLHIAVAAQAHAAFPQCDCCACGYPIWHCNFDCFRM